MVVSEITMETRMAVERVTANSRNSRPTMPPIIRIGMKTATSEMLMENTVKPISRAPLRAASHGRHAVLQVAGDVFHDDDGVVHDEAGGDGQCHQREIVEAEAEQVHHRERADQRDRHGDAGNQRGARASEKNEDHHHDQTRSR